jgi:hypothetical protein
VAQLEGCARRISAGPSRSRAVAREGCGPADENPVTRLSTLPRIRKGRTGICSLFTASRSSGFSPSARMIGSRRSHITDWFASDDFQAWARSIPCPRPHETETAETVGCAADRPRDPGICGSGSRAPARTQPLRLTTRNRKRADGYVRCTGSTDEVRSAVSQRQSVGTALNAFIHFALQRAPRRCPPHPRSLGLSPSLAAIKAPKSSLRSSRL